ncbi:gastric inhibitory polypeptide [Agelaius phoeniceus]|uniref:gastric inhibitory polypeptide n=2 Tax=Agelaius TaxID=9190 RepID=UPI004054C8E0
MGAAGAEESAGPSVPAVRLSRRYSEATLASDYSRTMDHVLRKNFVEWLLARRERKRHFPALEGSEGLREFWEQEFLTWLMSGELCRAT